MVRSLPKSNGPWILVVEDSPNLRRHLSIVLKDAGFSCIHATNEKEALARLLGPKETEEIAVVVADINLSEAGGDVRGGIVLAERLEQVQRRIPIILISYDPWIFLPPNGSPEYEDLTNRLFVRAVLDRNSDSFNRELVKCLREVTRVMEGER